MFLRVQTGSTYVKLKELSSPAESTHIVEYISPAEMLRFSDIFSVCVSHTFSSLHIGTWQKVYIFGEITRNGSEWWFKTKIKRSKVKVTGNENVNVLIFVKMWIYLRQSKTEMIICLFYTIVE